MRTIFLPLLAVALAAPAFAADDLQLVQPGDHAKSCAVLGAEINALASGAPAAAAAPRRKGLGGLAKAFGGAMPLLGAAVPMLGMVGGQGGAVLMQAAGVAGSVGAQSQAHAAVANVQHDADETILREQRKQRLLAIFEEKSC